MTSPTENNDIKNAIDGAEEFIAPSGSINGKGERNEPSQVDILLEVAASADLFHVEDGTSFADIDQNGHRETWPIRSKGFKRWLTHGFYKRKGKGASADSIQDALNTIEARAHFDGPLRQVNLRVAGLDGRLYLDLVDEHWRAIEIRPDGWSLVDKPPVRFRRTAGMKPLPVPEPGGSIDVLRSFLNVRNLHDFVLIVAWLLAALRDCGPYPLLGLSGEQGTAKSTLTKILRSLVDPNSVPLRTLPRGDRDLFIAANNGHVIAFDNVSGLAAWVSDTFCRLSTGGGYAVRQLYTDMDEVLFEATRPLILNGIEDIIVRPDLADREISLTLEPIPEDRRRPEKEMLAAFEVERPRILGVLLDAVAHGLRMLPETKLEHLPRMADFALWVTACETAFWPAGTFESAYSGNRKQAVQDVLDADPVASALMALLSGRAEWSGTMTELLESLSKEAGEKVSKTKDWPATARALSASLTRSAPFLRNLGVKVDRPQGGKKNNQRIVTLSLAETKEEPSSAPAELTGAPVDDDLVPDLDLPTPTPTTSPGLAGNMGKPAAGPSAASTPASAPFNIEDFDLDAMVAPIFKAIPLSVGANLARELDLPTPSTRVGLSEADLDFELDPPPPTPSISLGVAENKEVPAAGPPPQSTPASAPSDAEDLDIEALLGPSIAGSVAETFAEELARLDDSADVGLAETKGAAAAAPPPRSTPASAPATDDDRWGDGWGSTPIPQDMSYPERPKAKTRREPSW